ncbi:protein phosphatase 2C domain-containing protein [Ditylenchus destructor]|uniref:Protein phosphatase 2C domain-containing protein n=1 Tax=Ditylenchus destructor TaxID=166010 RepID=A0AAD4NM55_9BILA|nr:protein phosphatase 2C domain-containing protein [Ditylenchus destructor]
MPTAVMQGDLKDGIRLQNTEGIQDHTKPLECDIKISVAAAQGGRKYMEDRVHIEVVRNLAGKLEYVFAGVYDGHGGTQASEYVKAHLHENITTNKHFFSDNDDDVLLAIRQGFIRTHYNMQTMVEEWPMTASGYPCTAGTTASCAIFRNGKLYTGHVGDSAIILGSTPDGESTLKLTDEHKPEDKVERDRIESVGGSVGIKAGISRVMWKRPIRGHQGPVRRSTETHSIPFLAIARALGDFWSLNPANNQYVVSPEPDVSVIKIKLTHKWVVMASDGLTNVLQTQRIIGLLKELEMQGSRHHLADLKTIDERYDPNPAQFLLNAAFNRWGSVRADNITVVCIKLENAALSSDQNCVDVEESLLSVDKELTKYPSDIIHVTKEKTQRVVANPVRVIYNGTVDRSSSQQVNRGISENGQHKNLKDGKSYTGPGFINPELPKGVDDASSDEEDTNAVRSTRKENSAYRFEPPAASIKELDFDFSTPSNRNKAQSFIKHSPHFTPFHGSSDPAENGNVNNTANEDLRPYSPPKSRLSIDPEAIGVSTSCYVAASTSFLNSSSLLSPTVMLQSMRTSSTFLRNAKCYTIPLPYSARLSSSPNLNGSISGSQPASSSHSYLWSSKNLVKRSPSELYKFSEDDTNADGWSIEKRIRSIFGRASGIKRSYQATVDVESGMTAKRRREDEYVQGSITKNSDSTRDSHNAESKRTGLWNMVSSVFSKYLPKSGNDAEKSS